MIMTIKIVQHLVLTLNWVPLRLCGLWTPLLFRWLGGWLGGWVSEWVSALHCIAQLVMIGTVVATTLACAGSQGGRSAAVEGRYSRQVLTMPGDSPWFIKFIMIWVWLALWEPAWSQKLVLKRWVPERALAQQVRAARAADDWTSISKPRYCSAPWRHSGNAGLTALSSFEL